MHLMASYGYPEYPPPHIGNESQHIRLGINLKSPSFLELPILLEIFAGNSDLKAARGRIRVTFSRKSDACQYDGI